MRILWLAMWMRCFSFAVRGPVAGPVAGAIIGALAGAVITAVITAVTGFAALADPLDWQSEWPRTDFSRHTVEWSEIFSGGPPRDGIPAIDDPQFVPVSAGDLAAGEPVISLALNGEAKAWPLRVLIWHEIANDVIGGVPVAVTYCPLCNAAIVFDRRLDGRVLDFGTTGKLRYSDLVMYDRQTESWWQQFLGEAIVGSLTGQRLKTLPARLESWERFSARHPDGAVLVPNNPAMRAYGANPYIGYDRAEFPFLYNGEVPPGIAPLARVVVVGDTAWPLALLRRKQKVEHGDIVIVWEPGQNSALDTRIIAEGRDVGNVTVRRREQQNGADALVDIAYDVTFAFVFHAFKPDGVLVRD